MTVYSFDRVYMAKYVQEPWGLLVGMSDAMPV
jgi:hypothetical protein